MTAVAGHLRLDLHHPEGCSGMWSREPGSGQDVPTVRPRQMPKSSFCSVCVCAKTFAVLDNGRES